MSSIIRRVTLTVLAMLPIASIAFAAKKALKLGELKGFGDETEMVGGHSEFA